MKSFFSTFIVIFILFLPNEILSNNDKDKNKSNICNIEVGFEFEVTATTVHFKNVSKGTYNGLVWEFGDNKISTDKNPQHKYQTPGTYTFCLTATNTTTHCEESYCGDIYIFD